MENTTVRLLDAWKAARKIPNDSQAAETLGVSRAAVSRWRSAGAHADAPFAEKMAKDLGLEVLPVLAAIEADRATREDARKTWARYGRGAFIAVCMMAGSLAPAVSEAEWNESSIMRSRKKRYSGGGVKTTRRRKPRPGRKRGPRITATAKA